MLRPTAIKVAPKENYLLDIEFDNGTHGEFDVKPYIKGDWYGHLMNASYFSMVRTDGFTVSWPEGQDICPDELYLGITIHPHLGELHSTKGSGELSAKRVVKTV